MTKRKVKYAIGILLIWSIVSIAFGVSWKLVSNNLNRELDDRANTTALNIKQSYLYQKEQIYKSIHRSILLTESAAQKYGKNITNEQFSEFSKIEFDPFYNNIQNNRFSPIIFSNEVSGHNSFGREKINPQYVLRPSTSNGFYPNQSFHIPLLNSDPIFFPATTFGIDLYTLPDAKDVFFSKLSNFDIMYQGAGIQFGNSQNEFDKGIYLGKLVEKTECNTSGTRNNFEEMILDNRDCVLGISFVAYLVSDVITNILLEINNILSNDVTNIVKIIITNIDQQIIYKDPYFTDVIEFEDINRKISSREFKLVSVIRENDVNILNVPLERTIISYLFFTFDIEDDDIKEQIKINNIIFPVCWAGILVIFTVIYYLVNKNFESISITLDNINTLVEYVNHEIRNPLALMIQSLELVRIKVVKIIEKSDTIDKKDLEYVAKNVNTSYNHVKLLISVVNDILDVQTLDLKVHKKNFTLGEMANNIYESLIHKIDEYKIFITYETDIFDENYIVYNDPLRVEQILRNYILNAFAATESGTIILKLDKISNEIKISVIDTGSGVPENIQPYIFKSKLLDKKFKTSINNNGVGLYLCKRISEFIGGRVEYKTKLGKGSEFSLYLPLDPIETMESQV